MARRRNITKITCKRGKNMRCPFVGSKRFFRKQALFIRLIYVYFFPGFSATIMPSIFAFILLCTEDAIMLKHICIERSTCSTHTVVMEYFVIKRITVKVKCKHKFRFRVAAIRGSRCYQLCILVVASSFPWQVLH